MDQFYVMTGNNLELPMLLKAQVSNQMLELSVLRQRTYWAAVLKAQGQIASAGAGVAEDSLRKWMFLISICRYFG